MKIVIQTQVRENYAAHDGFKGEYYWKYKGGNTFVVPDLTPAQVELVKERGLPTLTALIEERNDYFEECILDWSVVDNHVAVCEDYETPFELRWIGGRWVATRTVENGEYGYMRQEIERKTEEYDMEMGGKRSNYRAVYTLRDGRVMDEKGLQQALAA